MLVCVTLGCCVVWFKKEASCVVCGVERCVGLKGQKKKEEKDRFCFLGGGLLLCLFVDHGFHGGFEV